MHTSRTISSRIPSINFVICLIEQSNCLIEIFFEKIELDQLALSVSQWRPEHLKDTGFFFSNDNSLSNGQKGQNSSMFPSFKTRDLLVTK